MECAEGRVAVSRVARCADQISPAERSAHVMVWTVVRTTVWLPVLVTVATVPVVMVLDATAECPTS